MLTRFREHVRAVFCSVDEGFPTRPGPMETTARRAASSSEIDAPPTTSMPLATAASEGATLVSWNIGLRGLRQLVDATRGSDKLAAKDEHGVSRQLGYGSVDALLGSLGDSVRVVCLQETKLSRGDRDRDLACPAGWDSVFSTCRARGKSGYAGVAVYFRSGGPGALAVVAAEEGVTGALAPELDLADAGEGGTPTGAVGNYGSMSETFTGARMLELDSEGRAVVVDFGAFVLVNVYVPAVTSADAEEAEARSAFKRDFLTAVEMRYRALLAAGRRVVMCGDWNIAPTALDTAHAPPLTGPGAAEAFVRGNPSRAWLRRQLAGGDGAGSGFGLDRTEDDHGQMIDVFRRRYPTLKGAYTCWNVAAGAQITNYGSRIDYFLADADTAARVTRAGIAPEHQGSDHCPVFITLEPGVFDSFDASRVTSPPPLVSSVALARAGRQGNLDAFFAAGAARRGGSGGGGGFGGGGGGVGASLMRSQPSYTSVGAKRKAETSIKSFFKPKGGRGSAADSRLPPEPPPPPPPPPDPDPPVATVTASRETVEAWRRIQLRQQPPKCRGHGETCKIRTVKKAGENFGRVFFACPRPAGQRSAGGDCGFFQWAYDRR